MDSLRPGVPVLAQVKIVGGVGGGHQLKNGECDTAGIYFLEHLTDRFLLGVAGQFDGRHPVLEEALHHVRLELVEGVQLVLVLAVEPLVAPSPCRVAGGVKENLKREESQLVFFLAGARVQLDVPVEVGPYQAVGGEGAYRVFPVGFRIQGGGDIDVVDPINVLALFSASRDGLAAAEGQVQRGHALLPVEDQELRLGAVLG